MKKIKIRCFLILFSLLIIPIFISAFPAPTASAYDRATEGDQTTARQKEWSSIFIPCVAHKQAWWQLGGNIPSFSNGYWFGYTFIVYDSHLGISNNYYETTIASPWVEKQVTGSYSDGKIQCGENENKLVSGAMGSLGLQNLEVACDYNNPVQGGILNSNDSGSNCSSAVSGSTGLTFNSEKDEAERTSYMENLINKNNDIPESLDRATDLEHYFILYDTFTSACVAEVNPGPFFDNVDSYAFQIYVEGSNGRIARAGFNRKKDTNGNEDIFYTPGKSESQVKTTCNDIKATLGNPASIEVQRFDDYLLNGGTFSTGCYDAGVEGISYVICPAIDNGSDFVNWIEGVLEYWLRLSPDEIFSPATYEAWNIFRNIANTLITIVLLFIVFSQLTGYGIDNYGIKKMLPRLITIAIIINLSYVICELAVDLSNILGSGLYDLFKNIGIGINGGSTPVNTAAIINTIMGSIGGVGGAIAPTLIAEFIGGGWVGVVIALALLLLAAIAAVLVAFIMLGARMAIVIVFVVIAPVAFALYMLPNTQSIFKKYWKIAQAALVVFPICGALVGSSYIIKAVIYNAESPNMLAALIAVCIPFMPFFLIPSLLRGALAGLGSLGASITAMGNGLRKGITSGGEAARKGIEGSQGYKDLSERRQARRAERLMNRLKERKNLNEAQRRRLGRARRIVTEHRQQLAQDKYNDFELDQDTADERAKAAADAQEYRAWQDRFADPTFNLEEEADTASFGEHSWYDPNDRRSRQRMRALISAMESRGMERKIFEMLRETPDIGKDEAAMDALASSSNRVLKAYGKKGAGQTYEQFMKGTGLDDNGEPKPGMRDYVADKGVDFLDGLDDKALEEISKYSSGENQIMSPTLTVEAAAKTNREDSIRTINEMLQSMHGRGKEIKFSPEQLAHFNLSTIQQIGKIATDDMSHGRPQLMNDLCEAYEAITRDERLAHSIPRPIMAEIESILSAANDPSTP